MTDDEFYSWLKIESRKKKNRWWHWLFPLTFLEVSNIIMILRRKNRKKSHRLGTTVYSIIAEHPQKNWMNHLARSFWPQSVSHATDTLFAFQNRNFYLGNAWEHFFPYLNLELLLLFFHYTNPYFGYISSTCVHIYVYSLFLSFYIIVNRTSAQMTTISLYIYYAHSSNIIIKIPLLASFLQQTWTNLI